ncbi:MAG TPA: transcription-repair coupling factor [Chloroflexota bacterium]|nr:transcription-repair coupling factor [Chloroflexota bacterium]
MNLSGLLPLLDHHRGYEHVLRGLSAALTANMPARTPSSGPAHLVASVVDPAKPYLIARLARDLQQPILMVVSTEVRARLLVQQIAAWSDADSEVYVLPAPEPTFYERLPSHPTTKLDRLKALQTLVSARAPTVVVASIRSLMLPVDDPGRFRALGRTVRHHEQVRPDSLVATLLELGYTSESLVEYPSTFSRRGGIVDVFPVDAEDPSRLEFFGDEVESIRRFDPTTQRSLQAVGELRLSPSREVPVAVPATLDLLRAIDVSHMNEAARGQWLRDLERLADGVPFDGIEFYAPYLASHGAAGYLAPNGLVVVDEPASVAGTSDDLASQAEELRTELLERGEIPADFRRGYFDWAVILRDLSSYSRLDLSWHDTETERKSASAGHASTEIVGRLHEFRPVPSYAGRLGAALDDVDRWRTAGTTTVLVSQQSARVADVLNDAGQPVAVLDNVAEEPESGALLLVHGSLDEGFELHGPAGGLVVLTDREVFGWTKTARTVATRRPNRDAFLSDLTPGDFVVHVDHGVGKFLRMALMPTEGGEREYLILEYAAGDRLYVPADQTDRVMRYVGVGDHNPTLHRLGTTEWSRARNRVKAAVQEVAAELLRLYAARSIKPGHAFSSDSVWQNELEDSFPYAETPDQLRAINEVKADMEQPRPMDRLLCGDVGYGKTEVALRAAFKAVGDSRQVGVLVPTTILAQQHFNTFCERLQAFPIRVEMLSRFRSDKEQQQVIDGLAAGTVDICIGTHRLVQKDVVFRNLGLVIVDEEQRFGVTHKEHFKKLRTEVDVLTLSATPIPRTLHMALVGARDLSVMETPPEDRLPIRTTVSTYDESLIHEVILREIDRGGQVFFVHNRVQTIYQMAHRLSELIPHASVVVGHGQMPEDNLEKVMLDFAAGRYDVLVCSTIIESGLDIPNVNTIIVNRADQFGLAQLYQLRGRVGRGANRAYAYFLTPKDRQLSEIAEKRLRTIFEASDLGAGYRVAMKDLEIRGAGNLLGAEQHGHVAAVGFHMYTQLLAEAVSTLKGEEIAPTVTVVVDLPLEAFLPSAYVDDEKARLSLYARLANLADASAVGELMLELRDRYGELPEPALNLMYLVQLKLLAAAGGIAKISADGKDILIQLKDGRTLPADALRRKFGSLLTIGRTQVHLDRARMGANWLATLQEIVDVFGETGVSLSSASSLPRPAARSPAPPAPETFTPRGQATRLAAPTRRQT